MQQLTPEYIKELTVKMFEINETIAEATRKHVDLKYNQTQLLQEMQKKGFNAVTCECGAVFLHRTKLDTIQCPNCLKEADISEFPDLYY